MANSNALRYMWASPDVGEAVCRQDPVKDVQSAPIQLGLIGTGNMGRSYTLERLLDNPAAHIVALCDCDKGHLAQAVVLIREKTGRTDVLEFADFRELNRSEAVEAVVISTPDHWHALHGIDAMRRGKDVYIEKPLSLTVRDGRRIADVAAETARICQTGTQQRSAREFRFACELVRNGRIGEVRKVNVKLPFNNLECPVHWEPMPVPDELDYEMWLGPAPWQPYHELRCHYTFRFVSDHSGGQMTNWGAHHLDIVQWGLGMDDSGPIEVVGSGVFPDAGIFDTATEMTASWRYPGDEIVTGSMGEGRGVEFIGTEGRVCVAREYIETTPESLLETQFGPGDTRLYRSPGQLQNFFECIRTRQQPISPAEIGHRSATVCHIGNIAIKLGRRLQWDPKCEQFVGDDEANAMLSRPMREPWSAIDSAR